LKASSFRAWIIRRHPLDPATGAVELPEYRRARAHISHSALAFSCLKIPLWKRGLGALAHTNRLGWPNTLAYDRSLRSWRLCLGPILANSLRGLPHDIRLYLIVLRIGD